MNRTSFSQTPRLSYSNKLSILKTEILNPITFTPKNKKTPNPKFLSNQLDKRNLTSTPKLQLNYSNNNIYNKENFYNKILKVELISPISDKLTSRYKTFSKEQKKKYSDSNLLEKKIVTPFILDNNFFENEKYISKTPRNLSINFNEIKKKHDFNSLNNNYITPKIYHENINITPNSRNKNEINNFEHKNQSRSFRNPNLKRLSENLNNANIITLSKKINDEVFSNKNLERNKKTLDRNNTYDKKSNKIYNDFNNDYFINNNINGSKGFSIYSSSINTMKIEKKDLFDLEQLFILENKINAILKKLISNKPCYNECNEWINFYFYENISHNLIFLFKEPNNQRVINYIIKIELLSVLLCCHISYNKNFMQYILLLQLIFEQIYNNYIILIQYLLHKTTMTYDNLIYYEKLYNIIKKELNLIINKENLNENYIIQILKKNTNNIGTSCKKLIDNIYLPSYNPENKNNKKISINNNNNVEEKIRFISSFFINSFLFIDNFSTEEFHKFFELYLFQTDINGEHILIKEKIEENNINALNIYSKYLLPKISPKFKYSLVLDLDETLIYLQRESNLKTKKKIIILRPYLYEFLQRMKKIYELILFSLGTSEYVNPIVDLIEKKEKYFQYRLFRQHGRIYKNVYIKDLNQLGRDLKKIIIIDNMPQSFKLNKNNGICIKGFYGDINNDNNTLKNLSNILEKIKFDADQFGDIRESLLKEKQEIIMKVTSN